VLHTGVTPARVRRFSADEGVGALRVVDVVSL
jgi:hypothetical protein